MTTAVAPAVLNRVTNAGLETDTSGWTVQSAITQPPLTRSNNLAYVEAGSWALAWSLTADVTGIRHPIVYADVIPVTPGQRWYLRVYGSGHAGQQLGVRDDLGSYHVASLVPGEFQEVGRGSLFDGSNGKVYETIWTVPPGIATAAVCVVSVDGIQPGDTWTGAGDGWVMGLVNQPRLPLAISPLGERILETLPPWYANDNLFARIVDSVAQELQRAEDFLNDVRTQMLPQNADDTYGILGMWEALYGVPVEPPGVSLEARQAIVVAHSRKRSISSGSAWEGAVTEALNTNQWTYQEGIGPYQVTIKFPYSAGGYSSGQALALLREITPAHLILNIGYNQGWLVGISLVGVDVL